MYAENFDDFSAPHNFDNGTYRVEWCDLGTVTSSNFCPTGNSYRLSELSDDPIIWVYVGTEGCTQVRIDFQYSQFQSTGTVLRSLASTDTTLSCSRTVSTAAVNLTTTGGVCTSASHTVNVTGSNRSVYWKFDSGSGPSTAIFIDSIRITLTGCNCDPGPNCVTTFSADFGTIFQSGTVCSRFPTLFETCEGNGPYLSSGTSCGGVADEVMTFGSGFPYSAATTRCLDLTGLASASLQFRYTKISGSLGPRIDVSVGGGAFTQAVWRAPFTFPGGCVQECLNLTPYVGQNEVRIKFVSDTSSTTQGHAFDDILLVRNASCPPDQACCYGDGTCFDLQPADCTSGGGTAQGAGSTCAGTVCPSQQACCMTDGSCADLLPADCTSQGGTPQGAGSACASVTCPAPEACCFADASCQDLFPADCSSQGGVAQGPDTDCAGVTCPTPEACCFADGTCQDVSADDCAAAGGTAQGPGTDCATAMCPELEACCLEDGTCADLTFADCSAQGGVAQGPGTSCDAIEIPLAEAGAGGAVSCSSGPLQLSGSASGCSGALMIYWTTDDGNIISGADTLTPMVDSPGTYVLHASCDNGCEAMDAATVTQGRAPCDLDNDTDADDGDFSIFLASYGRCIGNPQFNFEADLDKDGCVTLVDYQMWRSCWRVCNDVGRSDISPAPTGQRR